MNTTSCPVGTRPLRVLHASRVIRFSRFLRTAPPHPRATITAMRETARPFGRQAILSPPPSMRLAEETSPLISKLL